MVIVYLFVAGVVEVARGPRLAFLIVPDYPGAHSVDWVDFLQQEEAVFQSLKIAVSVRLHQRFFKCRLFHPGF